MPGNCGRPLAGIGYRHSLHRMFTDHFAEFGAFEVTADHVLGFSSAERERLDAYVGKIPIVLHGLGLSLGTEVCPDPRYLNKVAEVIEWVGAPYYSEHLAFTGVPGNELGVLLPLPRTRAVAEGIIKRIEYIRSYISVPMCLENIAYYFRYSDNEMGEAEFLKLICEETGSSILLDLQNLCVNSANFGEDTYSFIDCIPANSVKALHLAGGTVINGVEVDTHGHPVAERVFETLAYTLRSQSPIAVILERDNRLDASDEIMSDFLRMKNVVAANDLETHSARRITS